MKIKGIVIKIDVACWSDDRGNDNFGYVFYINDRTNGFKINEKTINGRIFKNNIEKILNNEIEFSCDKFGCSVKLSKQTIDKLK
jgi:hypothetical protein